MSKLQSAKREHARLMKANVGSHILSKHNRGRGFGRILGDKAFLLKRLLHWKSAVYILSEGLILVAV